MGFWGLLSLKVLKTPALRNPGKKKPVENPGSDTSGKPLENRKTSGK
jgi:hypothetical protein